MEVTSNEIVLEAVGELGAKQVEEIARTNC